MDTRTVALCIVVESAEAGYFKAWDVILGFAAVAENAMQMHGL